MTMKQRKKFREPTKKIWLITLATIITLSIELCLWWQQRTPVETLRKTAPQSPIYKNWPTYRNEKYSFEFKYPPGSKIETEDFSGYPQYVRIQNYTSTIETRILAPKKYFLEIFIYDHLSGQSTIDCPNYSIIDPQKVKLGEKVIGYRGHGLQEIEYAGGEIFRLCVKHPEIDLSIQIVESHPKGPLANPILDSFRFIL